MGSIENPLVKKRGKRVPASPLHVTLQGGVGKAGLRKGQWPVWFKVVRGRAVVGATEDVITPELLAQ